MERSKLISGLLSKYDATFKLSEVEALIAGEPLPTDANPTLIDIEQAFDINPEQMSSLIPAGSSGNDNTE